MHLLRFLRRRMPYRRYLRGLIADDCFGLRLPDTGRDIMTAYFLTPKKTDGCQIWLHRFLRLP